MNNNKNKIFNFRKHYFFIFLLIWTIVGLIVFFAEKDKSIYLYINGLHTRFGDRVFPLITYLGTFPFIAIVCLSLFLIPKFRKWNFFILMAICNLFPLIIVQILKSLFNHPRPLRYFDNASWIHKVAGQPEHFSLGFPSGHSEGIFTLCCFLALLLPKRLSLLGIPLFLIGLLVAFSRVYLSQHFYEDVFVGSLVGAYGVLIAYWVFHRIENRNRTQC